MDAATENHDGGYQRELGLECKETALQRHVKAAGGKWNLARKP